jgi:hypothetical protein
MSAYQKALVPFAVALGGVIAIAFMIILESIHTRDASNGAIPGTIGLARPHPQLDRAPGTPILKDH